MTACIRRLGWFTVFLLVSSHLAHADKAPPQLLGEWPSPDGHSIARLVIELPPDLYEFTVKSTEANSKVIPWDQHGEMTVIPDLNPPCRGFWSSSSDRFLLVQPTKCTDGSYSIGATPIKIIQQPPAYPDDETRPRFTASNQFTPDLFIEDMSDRLSELHPLDNVRSFGRSFISGLRWRGDGEIELDSSMELTLANSKDKVATDYLAKRSIVYAITMEGFHPVTFGPMVAYQVDRTTKKESIVDLPPATGLDNLRAAVRADDVGRVKTALAQGADPNQASAAQSPLCLAIGKSRTVVIEALLQGGAKVGLNEICVALSSQSPDHWDQVLDVLTKVDDDTVISAYDILFFGPPKGVKTEDAWMRSIQDVTNRLVKLGGNINARDERTDKTPLMAAASKPLPSPLLEILLKAGADPSLKDKAGESATDLAAKHFQIPALRTLDKNHQYADFLKQYDIPANSSFLGPWTQGGYIATLTLNPDATGTFASMFGGNVIWKQVGQTVDIQIQVSTRSRQEVKILTASGRLSEDGKTLLLKFTGEAAKTLGSVETKFEKGSGDNH